MIKTKRRLEDNPNDLALGLVLNDQLCFSLLFQAGDLNMPPTAPQKLMFLDQGQQVLLCTSRNIAKTISIRGRILRLMATYLPKYENKLDEALVFTPAEAHMTLLVDVIFSFIHNNIAFKALVEHQKRGDKPEIKLKTRLRIFFRIEGLDKDDINMAGIHPIVIFGDELAWGNSQAHRSRISGAVPGCKWLYAGVPNGVRSSPFYALDQTVEGDDWSRHHMSMLNANPLFIGDKAYRHKMIRQYGGENSQAYINQVLGLWGDESLSSFPVGSVAWDRELPYFIAQLNGKEVEEAILTHSMPQALKIPNIRCSIAAIGWDYGYSPDPTTFLVAVRGNDDGIWRTHCRVSLFTVPLPHQIEVLKYIVSVILGNKLGMLSVDSQQAYHILLSEQYGHLFNNRCRLTNPGGRLEVDLDTSEIINEAEKNERWVATKRKENRIIKADRKYWLTEQLRRLMMNHLLNVDDTRLVLGYDAELENEMIGTIERKTEHGHTVYDAPRKGTGRFKTALDQILDATRGLTDSILTIEEERRRLPFDPEAIVNAMGWAGVPAQRGQTWRAPWEIGRPPS